MVKYLLFSILKICLFTNMEANYKWHLFQCSLPEKFHWPTMELLKSIPDVNLVRAVSNGDIALVCVQFNKSYVADKSLSNFLSLSKLELTDNGFCLAFRTEQSMKTNPRYMKIRNSTSVWTYISGGTESASTWNASQEGNNPSNFDERWYDSDDYNDEHDRSVGSKRRFTVAMGGNSGSLFEKLESKIRVMLDEMENRLGTKIDPVSVAVCFFLFNILISYLKQMYGDEEEAEDDYIKSWIENETLEVNTFLCI